MLLKKKNCKEFYFQMFQTPASDLRRMTSCASKNQIILTLDATTATHPS